MPRTILEVLKKAEAYLAQQGSPSPRLDAGLLLAHVLECDRVQLYVDYARPLDEVELEAYRVLLRRRARHEPVAYLTGTKEFWSLPIQVDSRVLIPRPDTETVLEVVSKLFRSTSLGRFADVGTGSGCLACALLSMYADSQGVAIDRDANALEVARKNLATSGSLDRIQVVCGHLLGPLQSGQVDLIVANLPYIPSGSLESLAPDIRFHEPLLALDGGQDGLDLVRELVGQAPARLVPGGWLVVEVGDGQADEVLRLCQDEGFTDTDSHRDLAGCQRVVVAKCAGM